VALEGRPQFAEDGHCIHTWRIAENTGLLNKQVWAAARRSSSLNVWGPGLMTSHPKNTRIGEVLYKASFVDGFLK
jgi:hypothetical protein